MTPRQDNTPYGYCHCGCGHKTTIANRNSAFHGMVKGEPRNFMHGHCHRYSSRRAASRPIVVDGIKCMTVPLTRGRVAIVDVVDHKRLMTNSWQSTKPHKSSRTSYAVRHAIKADGQGVGKNIWMHRVVLNMAVDDSREADHRNGNGLDNRRSNLRIVTSLQNRVNVGPSKSNTTGFKGITRHGTKWRARVNIGCFNTPEEAARAYDKFMFKLHGDFARLNFPKN